MRITSFVYAMLVAGTSAEQVTGGHLQQVLGSGDKAGTTVGQLMEADMSM